MVDYFKDVHKTGMDRVLAEAEHRRQEYEERVSNAGPIAGRVPMSIEETVALFAFFSVFIGLWYYAYYEFGLESYWSFGLGLISGIAVKKLLMGPLFFILILSKWLITISMLGGIIYLIFASVY